MVVLELAEADVTTRAATPKKEGRKLSAVERLREELDGYLEQMQTFPNLMPEEVFRLLSAWTARGTELRIQLNRSDNQRSSSFRTKEIEPFLDECDRQFKFHSRIQASQEMDLKLVPRGQT